MIIQGVSYLSDFEAKKAIIAAAAKLYGRGWMIAGDGSMSVRVGPDAIWVTLAGSDKSSLTQDKLVRIDLNGRQTASGKQKPLGDDIEAQLRIYRENERIRSIVHAYPVCAAALSTRGKGAEAAAFTPAVRKLGRISLSAALKTEQAISDTVQLSKKDNGVILEGDGCMMWGASPEEAADYVEILDYYCRTVEALTGKPGGLGYESGKGGCCAGSSGQNEASCGQGLNLKAACGISMQQNGAFMSPPQFNPVLMQYYYPWQLMPYPSAGLNGFIPKYMVQNPAGAAYHCTAECAACGNTACTERRTGAAVNALSNAAYEDSFKAASGNAPASYGSAEKYSSANEAQNIADKKYPQSDSSVSADAGCSHNCGECRKSECSERDAGTCSGSCSNCQNEGCHSRQYSEQGSSLLPPGMTGLIRPGQKLPPIPDEDSSTAAVEHSKNLSTADTVSTSDINKKAALSSAKYASVKSPIVYNTPINADAAAESSARIPIYSERAGESRINSADTPFVSHCGGSTVPKQHFEEIRTDKQKLMKIVAGGLIGS